MTVYYLNLLGIAVLGFLLIEYRPTTIKNNLYLLVTSLILILIAGLRYKIGFDYLEYEWLFHNIGETSWKSVFSLPYDPGFTLLYKIIYSVTSNYTLSNFIIAGITTGLVALVIKFYSKNAWVSVYLYVTLTFFYGSMNFIRQNLAGAIALLSLRYAKERRFVPFLLLVLAAASVHQSALILLPAYFIANIRVTPVSLSFYGLGILLFFIAGLPLMRFVTQYIFIDYAKYLDSEYLNPTSLKYIVLPAICCVTTLIFSKRLLARDKGNLILINYSIYSLALYIIMTRFFILERFSIYFFLPAILLIPEILELLKPSSSLLEQRAACKQSLSVAKGDAKKQLALQLTNVKTKIKDHMTAYYTGIAAVLILGMTYHIFASTVGFHGVFPYRWIFETMGTM